MIVLRLQESSSLDRVKMLSPAQNLRRVLQGGRPQYIPVDYHGDPRFGRDGYVFLVHEGASAPDDGGYDLWGVRWMVTEDSLLFPVEHPAATLEDAWAMPFPDIGDPSLWEEARAQAGLVREDTIVIAFLICTLWERLWSLVGFEKALLGLARQPKLASAVLGRIADWQIACAEQFLAIGVDATRITDDYGAQGDLLMAPDTWRRTIRPHLKRIVRHYQEAGVPVLLHSCGNLARIMDDLVDMGFAAFNLQTSANGLAVMRKRYARRLRVWGGVPTQLLTGGTPDQIRDAVRWAICNLGCDGGLILAPDQYIPVPERNLQAFYQAAHEVQGLLPLRLDQSGVSQQTRQEPCPSVSGRRCV